MAKGTKKQDDKIILHRFRGLSPEGKRQVIEFMDFLALREKSKKWVEFDEWALNLAKERGFAHLREKDVARIVSDFRRSE